MSYGIISTGFSRKPLSVILAEIEELMRQEFGQDVIQTSQSPLGQLNGLFASLGSRGWQMYEGAYQSRDPDQAEGINLDTLAKLRLINRGDKTDTELRLAITNAGQSRINLQDISAAVAGITGVTYSHVFVNETGETVEYQWERGTIVVAVTGGEDEEIANVLWDYIIPGINTYGNYVVTANVDGYCRSFSIIRPIEIPVTLTIHLRTFEDNFGCPAPSASVIRDFFVTAWNETTLNGKNFTDYTVRQLIESNFNNVEYLFIEGSRDGLAASSLVDIAFIEIGTLTADNVTVIFDTVGTSVE